MDCSASCCRGVRSIEGCQFNKSVRSRPQSLAQSRPSAIHRIRAVATPSVIVCSVCLKQTERRDSQGASCLRHSYFS
jgi:hypothetical protein